MPFHFLTDIPRELRDKIYFYALTNPTETGGIPIFPRNFQLPLSLALLLACRQIRRECKELIWFHNRLWIPKDGKSELRARFEHYAGLQQFRQIKNIVIRLELLDWDELSWICQSLQPLIPLAKDGNLKSIRLLAKTDRLALIPDFTYLNNLKRDWECVDGRWYRAAQVSGLQARYSKKFAINTGYPRFHDEGKEAWIRNLLVNDAAGMEGFLEALHELYGGEVYVNGSVCFRNGDRIREVIRWDPKEGEIEIRPEKLLKEESSKGKEHELGCTRDEKIVT
ncbi:hypothetical protein F5884DRAFT_677073 [Xylogone sp. PMI_703]|nr:hypothetical protein F5884DRAFT_677073 [Xylogone sp. PMI_703]